MVVFRAELGAAQVEFADFMLRCDESSGCGNLFMAECNTATDREARSVGNLRAAGIALDAFLVTLLP